MDSGTLHTVGVLGSIDIAESNEDVISILRYISDYGYSDRFTAQISEINEEAPLESTLFYANSMRIDSSTDQGSFLLIQSDDDEDEELTFQTQMQPDFCEEFIEIFSYVTEEVSITINEMHSVSTMSVAFDDLNISVEGPADYTVTGINVVHDGISHIIQASSELDPAARATDHLPSDLEMGDDEDGDFCGIVSSMSGRVNPETGEFIMDHVAQVDETLSAILPET